MTDHLTPEGVPLRADGTPFPEDPNQWTAEERQYLEAYVFGVDKHDEEEGREVAMVDVPEHTGEAMA
jgi:hypothetical protein